MIEKIISGGQTGVDRAALDVALELKVPCGGWCPQGRLAEDSSIPLRYPLIETPSADYAQRTEWNVRDSDGTLVLVSGPPTGGTAMTIATAARLKKPALVLEVTQPVEPRVVDAWLQRHQIRVLNIAGPRESGRPGIYAQAVLWLRKVFGTLKASS